MPWRRVISIGNLNKGFKERSLVVRPLPAPLLNIVFPPVAVSLPCSRQNSAPGATTRSPRIIHVATFHVASKSRDFATTHPSTPPTLPSICCSYDFPFPCSPVTLSRFLLGGRQGGRGEEGGWQACFPAYRSCLVEPRTTRLTFVAEQASSAVDEITEIKTEEGGKRQREGEN